MKARINTGKCNRSEIEHSTNKSRSSSTPRRNHYHLISRARTSMRRVSFGSQDTAYKPAGARVSYMQRLRSRTTYPGTSATRDTTAPLIPLQGSQFSPRGLGRTVFPVASLYQAVDLLEVHTPAPLLWSSVVPWAWAAWKAEGAEVRLTRKRQPHPQSGHSASEFPIC